MTSVFRELKRHGKLFITLFWNKQRQNLCNINNSLTGKVGFWSKFSLWFALQTTSKYRQGQANNTFKLPRAFIPYLSPSFQHVTELLSIIGLHWKTGQNEQMSMLLIVISAERLRWAFITKSVNCCSLTLQFHSKRWSWRAVFSLALWWGAERAQSDNQNQKCCCFVNTVRRGPVDDEHVAIDKVKECEMIGEQEQTAAPTLLRGPGQRGCQELFRCCHLRRYRLHFVALQSGQSSRTPAVRYKEIKANQ